MRLYLPKYGNTIWDTRASLDSEAARTAFTEGDFWRYRDDRVSIVERIVAVHTLDEFAVAPEVLKIDVEGTEEGVIAGAQETIDEYRPVILAEGTRVASIPALIEMGYEAFSFDPRVRAFTPGPGLLNTFMLCHMHRDFLEADF
jgi:hypothetical protein